MAFRKQYQGLVIEQKLTKVFRPGNRVYPNWRGYKEGEHITARIIEKCGCDEHDIPPTFNPIKVKARIKTIQVQSIDSLTQHDFDGSSPDVSDIHSLKQHLQDIYQKPISDYHNLVTQIELEYLNAS